MSDLTSRKTLAIDLDSVLADTMVVWVEEFNKPNNSSISISHLVSFCIGFLFKPKLQIFECVKVVRDHHLSVFCVSHSASDTISWAYQYQGAAYGVKRSSPEAVYPGHYGDRHGLHMVGVFLLWVTHFLFEP